MNNTGTLNLRLKLTIIASSIFISLLAAEFICRLVSEFVTPVRYLATAGHAGARPVPNSLEQFLAGFAPIVEPGRESHHYRANSLGLYDQEFERQKSADTLRIVAIGDSFSYGSVPLPKTVLTQLEEKLNATCRSELYNFGVPGATVWDYKSILPFVLERFHPDVVLLNFYMGNDGPDTVHNNLDGPQKRRFSLHSFLFALVRNLWLLRRVDPAYTPELADQITNSALQSSSKIDQYSDTTAPFNQPTMQEVAWNRAMRDELFRIYQAPAGRKARSWQELETHLLEIKRQTYKSKAKLIITLYPARIQVDQRLRTEVINSLNDSLIRKGTMPEQFKPELPEQMLFAFCAEQNIDCFSVRPEFAAVTDPSNYYRPRDTHWNFAGNTLAAEVQAQYLKKIICG